MSDLIPIWQPWGGRVLVGLMVAVGLWLIWFGWRRRARRDGVPRCWWCGYDLSGRVEEACSECGKVTGEGRVLKRRGWRVWIALGLVVVIGAPSFVVQQRVRAFGWDYYLVRRPLYDLFPYVDEEFAAGDASVVLRTDRRRYSGVTSASFYPTRISVYQDGEHIDDIASDGGGLSIAMVRVGFEELPTFVPGVGDFDDDGVVDLIVLTWSEENFGQSIRSQHYTLSEGDLVLEAEADVGIAGEAFIVIDTGKSDRPVARLVDGATHGAMLLERARQRAVEQGFIPAETSDGDGTP